MKTIVRGCLLGDHGSDAGLGDDDHAQYALLAGRTGGQTIIGSIDSAGNLTLQSTAHATKGKILFGTSAYDEVNNRLGVGTISPGGQIEVVTEGAGNTLGMVSYNSLTPPGGRPIISTYRARGTLATPLAVATDDYLGTFAFFAHDGSGWQLPAALTAYADGTPTAGSATPARISIITGTNSTTRKERIQIKYDGAILIPNEIATTIPLAIKGAASQSANLQEWRKSDNTVYSVISSIGRGGFGTASPQNILEVSAAPAADGSSLRLSTTSEWTAGLGTGIEVFDTIGRVGHLLWEYDGTNTNLGIGGFYNGGYGTAAVNVVTIKGNGNVGFGIDAPTSRIHGVTTLSAATGNEIAFRLSYTTNKAAGNDTGLVINQTDTASPGTSLLVDFQVGGSSKFKVENGGSIVTPAGMYSTGILALQSWAGANGYGISMSSVNAFTNTSGATYGVKIWPTYNQTSGTAANTDLLVNRIQTAVGSGAQLCADFQVGGVSKHSFNNVGDAVHAGKFGCNGAAAQAAYASGGALAAYGAGAFGFDSDAHASALYAMVVSIRAALVANGIMS